MSTHLTTCPLCEATCGIVVTVDGDRVTAIRGDRDDPFSRGYICPKAPALAALHHDPDRIREPLRREGDRWVPIGWDAAFELIGERVAALQAAHGRDAVGMYFGNPTAHNYAALLGLLIFQRALGSRNSYSSASVDALPRTLVSAHLYGNQARLPVPDLERTRFLLVIGANPLVSNGSVMTAPNMLERLRALRARGGRLVVIDPRRTETAGEADAHHFIRPGTDALLLAAMVQVVLREGLATPRQAIEGADALRAALVPFAPARVAAVVGMPAAEITALARAFAGAESAVCYGRLGTCTQRFGALTTWLIDLLNLLTGNLDRVGGAMFPKPAVDLARLAERLGVPGDFDRWRSRVKGLPEFNGELPVAALADEMETPGPGQLRGMILFAGNPARTLPDSARLERLFAGLEFMVAIDLYRNETTRFAHLILPPPSPLEREHFALLFHALSVRETLKFSEPVLPLPPGQPSDWTILRRMTEAILRHRGGLKGWGGSALARLGRGISPRRLIDLLMRLGPYPYTVRRLGAHPHGLDLGPLSADRLPDRAIPVAQPLFIDDLTRLAARLDEPAPALVLIGRRTQRSMNSWLHNLPKLVAGAPRCTLQMHPDDARARGIEAGAEVALSSRTGEIAVQVELSDAVMPGVVSLPHGWGHPADSGQRVAAARGANMNVLLDADEIDPLSGVSVLTGVEVRVRRLRPERDHPEV